MFRQHDYVTYLSPHGPIEAEVDEDLGHGIYAIRFLDTDYVVTVHDDALVGGL